MGNFIGQNVADITKRRQGEVFRHVHQTVVGTVNVPAALADGDAVKIGTLLLSVDGGLTWSTLETPAYDPAAAPYAVNTEVYYQGHIYKNTTVDNNALPTDPSWDDLGEWNANGILYNDITETKKTTVVVTGDAFAKHLTGLDDYLKVILFKNKIMIK